MDLYRQRRKVAARPLVQALQRLVGPSQGEAGQAVGEQGVDEGLVEAGANDQCLCVAAMTAVSIARTAVCQLLVANSHDIRHRACKLQLRLLLRSCS